MEEQEGEISSPFWMQSSSGRHRNRQRSSSLFRNSGVLLFTLCLTFSLFIYFVLPPILSITPQIFKPRNLVKKSWDSLNVTLVLLALIFGFLSRNRNHDTGSQSFDITNSNEVKEKSNELTPRGWYEYPDRAAVVGLRRTYSSYPDLREITPQEDLNDRWRFYDDTSLYGYRRKVIVDDNTGSNGDGLVKTTEMLAQISSSEASVERVVDELAKPDGGRVEVSSSESQVTVSEPSMAAESVDKISTFESQRFVTAESMDRYSSSESQRFVVSRSADIRRSQSYDSILDEEKVIRQIDELPPQPPVVRRRTRQPSLEDIGNREKLIKQVSDSEATEKIRRGKTKRNDDKDEASEPIAFELDTKEYYKLSPPRKSEKKRGSGNATRNFLDSFRKKKKKQRQRSVENFESLLRTQPPTPPPPPPQNFFSFKKEKNKKFITVPPPPPPPPRHIARAQKSTITCATTTRRPPLPVKIRGYADEAPASSGDSPLAGAESPLHPIPPPPPPPPFKMPSWKFVVKGDYVKIGSISSSRSVSPDPDELDSPTSTESGGTPTAVDGADVAAGALFCPSPDVNSKADMFIAKFRAGLKLQKMNSMKQKQGVGLSNLGPTSKA